MYPPAPDQQPSSPYTPAGVTGSTPNNNPSPSQPQVSGFPPSLNAPPPTAFATNMTEFGGMPYGTGQMPMQPGNPAYRGAIQTPATEHMQSPMQSSQPVQGYAKGGLANAAKNFPASHHAKEAQKYGRGEDTMLIHMTPGEVGGLQALAKAHGGSLTTNPHTGLPEAGWLSKLLPTILGFGLSFIPGIGPLMAAGITGLGTTAVTGDLRQGLMAGLGAFGGASLAGGLGMGANAANVGKTVATTLPEATTAATALPSAVAPAANLAGVTNAVPAVGNLATKFSPAAAQAVSKAGSLMPSNLNLVGSFGSTASAIPSAGANLVDVALPAFGGATPSVAPAAPNLMGKLLGAKGQAFGERFANSAGQNLMGTASTPSAMRTGLAAMGVGMPIMDAMTPEYTMPTLEEYKSNYKGPYKPAPRNVRFLKDANRDPNDSSEFQYFDTVNPYPSYVPAGGGLASGGPVRFGNGGSATVGDVSLPADFDLSKVTTPSTYEIPKDNIVFTPQGYIPGQSAEHDYGFSKAVRSAPKGGGGGGGVEGGMGGGNVTGPVSGLGGVFNTMPGVISGGGTDAQNNLDTFINNAQDRIESTPFGEGSGISTGVGMGLGLDFNGGTSPGGMSFNLGGGSGSGSTGYAHSSGYHYSPTQMSLWGDDSDTGGLGGSGLKGLAGGGMTLRDGAFIVDARTVSELGNGSSGAGQELLAKHGGVPIRGPGDGVSDSIRANIGGKQEARVARDEVKFDPEAVARLGNGSTSAGARKLYALMNKAHKARKSAKRGQDTGLRGAL